MIKQGIKYFVVKIQKNGIIRRWPWELPESYDNSPIIGLTNLWELNGSIWLERETKESKVDTWTHRLALDFTCLLKHF